VARDGVTKNGAWRDPLAADSTDPESGVKYGTIVADPPWRYDNGTVPRGGVEHHYGTMTPAEICALPVADLAADNAHLYLWVTNLHLREGRPFDIIEAWGFSGTSRC